MAIFEKKVLLFIKSPTHNLRQVESFLKRREFDVYIESDIKAAISKVIEMRPNFIFLALDHSNPKVMNLPSLIAQASAATIVPYIMSTAKVDTRKFDISNLNPKLYPPVSGPAIERLVLKYGKHIIATETVLKKMNSRDNKSDSASIMKEYLLSSIESAVTENINESYTAEDSQNQQKSKIQFRHNSIHKRNEFLIKSKNSKISSAATNGLKNTLQDKIKHPLESLINALKETEENATGTENFDNKLMRFANPEATSTLAVSANLKAYFLSVYSDEWCGYLMLTADVNLEFSSIDIIFSDWIKLQFNNLQEADEYDFLEFKNIDSNMIQSLNKNAEYFESIKINDNNVSISFLSVDPSKMMLELNDEKNLIRIPTDEIPAEAELNFSLHLHLPENKKYLMYTQANKKFSHEQKNRLLANKVMTLYTPLDFEKEYRKFIFEKNIKDFYENLNQNKPTV